MNPVALNRRGQPRRRVARGASLVERIDLHSRKAEGGCWEWTAAIDDNGYGRASVDGRMKYAHRIAYEAFVGPIPAGLQIDHLCRTRHCVNPAHLEPVTNAENQRRAALFLEPAQACLRGHAYTPENTYMHRGRRSCRECRREAHARHSASP